MGIFDDEEVDTEDYLSANDVEVEDEDEDEGEEIAPPAAEEAMQRVADAEPSEPEQRGGIPLQELLYERRRRQELERKLDDQGSNLENINRRLQESAQRTQREQQQQQQQAVAAERPDEEDDPLGFANWRINQVEGQLKGLGQMARQGVDLHQSMLQQNQHQTIIQQSQSLQDTFAREKSDYWDAYNFLIGTRRKELQAMGYADGAVDQVLDNEKSMIVQNSMNKDASGQFSGWKQNPAQVVYNLAAQRGFAAGQLAPQVNPGQARVDRVAAGVRAANGTSGGRSTGSSPHSLESLAGMSDAEFDRFRSQNPGVLESMLGA
jgi:hypothetical protein